MPQIKLLLIVTFVVQGIISVPLSNSDDITDYYWREYTGVIPSDAIPGGTDRSAKRTYIGQMYSKSFGLLPATIYPGSTSAIASGGGKSFSADTFVKILCSRNLDRYHWIPTRNQDTHLLTDCHLVIGGTEAGYVLNIGRVNHEMQTVIGKVFAHHTPFRGLSIPNKQNEAIYQTYEILTYNCDLNRYLGNITYATVY
ncbi:hypothetical protein ILUMI_10905 [Ignelater luminosus]|uniref:Uncharacterized protein n=1 Tax=Ignelater luminosus TaxID=2038154 RepID=A0A8K0D321_IGNLU|nr:hypothetical protein ILUMI_10905 [Ignelater luminosus]